MLYLILRSELSVIREYSLTLERVLRSAAETVRSDYEAILRNTCSQKERNRASTRTPVVA